MTESENENSTATGQTPSTTEKGQTPATTDTGRTPSMIASLLVCGVMIGLIMLSVIFFGSDVAEGPLQVSMTLVTLFALSIALYYGFRGALISEAIGNSVNGTIGTIFVLLTIGAIIGTLYLSGTVAAFIYYGVEILSPRFYYVMVFIIAGALSMLLGSSLTTVGAVGVAFVGLATLILSTMLTSIGLNTLAADPYVSIVLISRMFRGEYIKERLKPVTLSTGIADSGTIFSGLIPWNVNGVLFAGTLGITTLAYALYAFLLYLTPLVTLIIGFLYFRKDYLPSEDNATTVYGKEPDKLPQLQRSA